MRRTLARVARCKAQAYEQELHDRVRFSSRVERIQQQSHSSHTGVLSPLQQGEFWGRGRDSPGQRAPIPTCGAEGEAGEKLSTTSSSYLAFRCLCRKDAHREVGGGHLLTSGGSHLAGRGHA